MQFLIGFFSRRFTQEALFGMVEVAMLMIIRYEFMKFYKSYRSKKHYTQLYNNKNYYGAIND